MLVYSLDIVFSVYVKPEKEVEDSIVEDVPTITPDEPIVETPVETPVEEDAANEQTSNDTAVESTVE